MPHTVHLSALEVHLVYSRFPNLGSFILSFHVQMLKDIGIVKESKKGTEYPYQDSVIAPLDQEHESHIDEKEDDFEDDDLDDQDEAAPSMDILGNILLVIGKVCEIDTS